MRLLDIEATETVSTAAVTRGGRSRLLLNPQVVAEKCPADCDLVMLVLHPQVTGRPMRMKILREFIAFTRKHDKVWYATAAEIAEIFQAQEQTTKRAAAE